jgi:hypothetical protein
VPDLYRRKQDFVQELTVGCEHPSRWLHPHTHTHSHLAYSRGIGPPTPLLAIFHKANSSLILTTSCCTLHCCLTLLKTLAFLFFQDLPSDKRDDGF